MILTGLEHAVCEPTFWVMRCPAICDRGAGRRTGRSRDLERGERPLALVARGRDQGVEGDGVAGVDVTEGGLRGEGGCGDRGGGEGCASDSSSGPFRG